MSKTTISLKKTLSESYTENIFREFYGNTEFIEKSAISESYGFKSKNSTKNKGYPDFFKECEDFVIIVEAKAKNQGNAIDEVKHYMSENNIKKDIIGMAVSGQVKTDIKANYFVKWSDSSTCKNLILDSTLLSMDNIHAVFYKAKYGDTVSQEELICVLKSLNKTFNDKNTIRDTDRSLFFSSIMIALKDSNFRNVYKNIQPPSKVNSKQPSNSTLLESINLNNAILDSIATQLNGKINNHSKEYNWRDRFAFIKNIDFSLEKYKQIILLIESKIYKPFVNNEKHDILGRAYKIFLSRAGKAENKNIILTPNHIQNLMIKLADLNTTDVVLDICTGTGGFLMSSMSDMIEKANKNEFTINNIKEKQLIGFEVDPVLFSLACTNMFLHGDGRTNMLFRSSLLNDNTESIVGGENLLSYIKSLKPTKCIINPPYENNNSIKFTIQAIEYLESNGKLIIIMPTPTLRKNQSGLTEKLLKMATLDFVIKMPYNLFSEQKRTVNTSIFGFTKKPHNHINEVLYYHLEDDGFISIQHKGKVDKYGKWESIKNHILDSIMNHKEIKGISDKRKIYQNDIINCSGFQEFSNHKTTMVKIGNIFDIEKGQLASEKAENGEYDFITASEEWKKHSEYTHNQECLIYATMASGSLGRSHYVNGKFIASNLCLILTEKNKIQYPINMQFYNILFEQKQKQIKSDLADGTSKLTIKEKDFKDYYIEYVDIEIQNSFVEKFIKPYNQEKKKLEQLVIKGKNKIRENINDLL